MTRLLCRLGFHSFFYRNTSREPIGDRGWVLTTRRRCRRCGHEEPEEYWT